MTSHKFINPIPKLVLFVFVCGFSLNIHFKFETFIYPYFDFSLINFSIFSKFFDIKIEYCNFTLRIFDYQL